MMKKVFIPISFTKSIIDLTVHYAARNSDCNPLTNNKYIAGSFRVSLFIDLGCPWDLRTVWRGASDTWTYLKR